MELLKENNICLKELNQQAKMLIMAEKYEQAKEYLNKALELDNKNKEIYMNLGNLYINLGEYKIAEQNLKKVILIDKKDPLAYFTLGNISILKEELIEAIEYYNKAISYGYEEALVYNNLAMVYEELKKDSMAIRNYSKAISKDKLNVEYRLRQIALYLEVENYNKALECLEELSKYSPDIYEGYHFRFEIYCHLEEYDKAEKIITEAINNFPKDISLLFDKVKLLNIQKKYNEAMELILEAKKMENYDLEERNFELEKAKIYAQKEDINNAIESLKKCIEEENGKLDVEARVFLMNAYLAIKDYENALLQAKEIINGEEEITTVKMSALYYEALTSKLLKKENWKNKFEEICKIYRNISLENTGNLDSYLFRALSYNELGDYKRALELVDYILLLRNDIPEVYHLQGKIYEAIGDKDNSKKSFENVKKYDPKYLFLGDDYN